MLLKNAIKVENISFSYPIYSGENAESELHIIEDTQALHDVSLEVKAGDMIAILGANGSGKSTLAKHLNALLLADTGKVMVFDKDTSNKDLLYDIRRSVGMVFQNPDNQIVGSIVEEDVGFGPENLNIETNEIWQRVDESLDAVNMQKHRYKSPNRLSGGQKQRVAIAGVLAMRPDCVVLDEATAMLDPRGRMEVMDTVKLLKSHKVTVIIITHYMDEVVDCDHVFVMSKGKICLSGTPKDIFRSADKMKELKLALPHITDISLSLRKYFPQIAVDCIYPEELYDELVKIKESHSVCMPCIQKEIDACKAPRTCGEELLKLVNVSYKYSSGTTFEVEALKNINLSLKKGEIVGIIGHTGSGKSTLVQHFNGLNKATEGHVMYRGQNIFSKGYSLKKHKGEVGMVFQYAEQQLFEATVIEDVCFGPLNQGYTKAQAMDMAVHALELVGMKEDYYERSPFSLSGGQKRRVAIAGIIAMQPKILVLDEPTAGLDPAGKERIMNLLVDLRQNEGMTIVLVSHSMEDVAEYTDRVVVLNKGEIAIDAPTYEALTKVELLRGMGLDTCYAHKLLLDFKAKGMNVDTSAVSISCAVSNIAYAMLC